MGRSWAAITDPPGVISAWGNFPLSMDGGIAHIPCTSFVQPSRLQLYEDDPNHLLNAAFKSHLLTLAAILQRSKKIGKSNWEGELSKRAFREGDSPNGGLRI